MCPSERRFTLLFTFLKKNRSKKIIVFMSTCNAVQFYSELLAYFKLDFQIWVCFLYCYSFVPSPFSHFLILSLTPRFSLSFGLAIFNEVCRTCTDNRSNRREPRPSSSSRMPPVDALSPPTWLPVVSTSPRSTGSSSSTPLMILASVSLSSFLF